MDPLCWVCWEIPALQTFDAAGLGGLNRDGVPPAGRSTRRHAICRRFGRGRFCPAVLWVASSLMLDTFVCVSVVVLAVLCVEGREPGCDQVLGCGWHICVDRHGPRSFQRWHMPFLYCHMPLSAAGGAKVPLIGVRYRKGGNSVAWLSGAGSVADCLTYTGGRECR